MAAKSTAVKIKRADGVVQTYHVGRAEGIEAPELPKPKKASTIEGYDKKIKYWNKIKAKAIKRRTLWDPEDGWNRHHLAMGVTGLMTSATVVNSGVAAHGLGVAGVFLVPLAALAAGASAYHYARTRIPAQVADRELVVLRGERAELVEETMTKKEAELAEAEAALQAAHERFKKAQAATQKTTRPKRAPKVQADIDNVVNE
jgi:hypothetical protein